MRLEDLEDCYPASVTEACSEPWAVRAQVQTHRQTRLFCSSLFRCRLVRSRLLRRKPALFRDCAETAAQAQHPRPKRCAATGPLAPGPIHPTDHLDYPRDHLHPAHASSLTTISILLVSTTHRAGLPLTRSSPPPRRRRRRRRMTQRWSGSGRRRRGRGWRRGGRAGCRGGGPGAR